MELDNQIFIKLLKKYTSIDEDFIDKFFKKFTIGDDLEFHISEKKVYKYLNITKKTLRDRLNNNYSKNNQFIENVDLLFINKLIKSSNKKNIFYFRIFHS